jgi:adenylate cyclase
VIPFDALGEQETQTYFAEGITLDVITALSRIPGLLVIAPGTAFGYRDSTQENPAIATELGVQYLIRGGVQRLGDRVRINVRLLRGDRGETLWAGRFAGDASSLFRIQDQVIEGITRALPVRLALSEPPGARLEATASIAAYDAFLQGQERYGRMTPEDNQAARRHFERAIELDPGFARAYAGLALAWSRLAIDGWTDDPAGDLLQAAEYADQATAIDPAVAQIHFVRAEVALFRGRHLAAAASAATAIELSPSYADAYALLAWIFNYAGRPDRAQAALNEAHRRNPRSSASYRQIAGEIAFTQGLYDKAVGEFQAALQRNPTHARARLWLAATLSELGQQDEAAWQVQELLTLNPAFSRSGLLLAFPLKDPDQREVVRRALAQLGLPE